MPMGDLRCPRCGEYQHSGHICIKPYSATAAWDVRTDSPDITDRMHEAEMLLLEVYLNPISHQTGMTNVRHSEGCLGCRAGVFVGRYDHRQGIALQC